MVKLNIVVLFLFSICFGTICAQYEPTWESLDTRPLPTWYDDAKIGIFLHWGVYSVPSIESEWFWNRWKSNELNTPNRRRRPSKFVSSFQDDTFRSGIMCYTQRIMMESEEVTDYMKNYFPPDFSYQEFARDFTAEFFDPTEWAQIFAKSGAKYVVLTSKHHEGFALWPSKYSFSWNAMDVQYPQRYSELGEAVRAANLKFGLYHSLYEWFNPLFLEDKANNFSTDTFSRNKVAPELYELVNAYKPSVIWSDGSGGADDSYWKSRDFIAWLYNDSPVKDEIVVNDRWGKGVNCHHGDFFSCHDRYDPGTLQGHKWENGMTLDKYSWGFRRDAKLSDYLTFSELLTTLTRTISCGGNLLINVGPTKDGIIKPIFEERLTQLGQWLDINGEAIYGSQPWTTQNDTLNGKVWYTSNNNAVYAIDLEWPSEQKVILQSAVDLFKSADTSVTLLGNSEKLTWTLNGDQVEIQLPDKATVKSVSAYVLKIIN